jgi:hypothetical protein
MPDKQANADGCSCIQIHRESNDDRRRREQGAVVNLCDVAKRVMATRATGARRRNCRRYSAIAEWPH